MSDYLDELDRLLLDHFDDGMLLSELHGFLTGLLVSPDRVPDKRWLPLVTGREVPGFEDDEGWQRFIDLLARFHDDVAASLNVQGDFEPIIDVDPRLGEIMWEIWIEGFATAMTLAPTGWNRLRRSEDEAATALAGMSRLIRVVEGDTDMVEVDEDSLQHSAPGLIAALVWTLHGWRLEQDRKGPDRKIGRNDPCPCGSGRKHKKCCGSN